MIRATSAALLLFLLALTGMTLWLGTEAHRLLVHLDGAVTRAEGIETKANATLINLDKGTAVWAAASKDQAGAVADLATDAHGTLSQANAALFSINDSAHALNEDLGALHQTIDAGTQTVTQATLDLRTLDSSFDALQPLVADSDRAVSSLNGLLADNAIHRTLDNLAGISDHVNLIAADAQKVSNKITADYLRPVPWWKKPIKKGGELIDITAAIARHAP